MKCNHIDGCEMRFNKMVQQTYEGEVVLAYNAYCNECGKRVKGMDEIKVYQY